MIGIKKDDSVIEILKPMRIELDEGIAVLKDSLRAIEEKLLMQDDTDYRASVKSESQKINPNLPCPCGSGKQYKFCCGRN